jgi:hypothetical protein
MQARAGFPVDIGTRLVQDVLRHRLLAGGGEKNMISADDFRRLALDLPGATEHAHMGHPDFRAHGRIFASLHTQDQFGMVKVTPEEQAELLRTSGAFEPSAGAWGRQGCTNVRLAAADERDVRGALLLAWELTAKQPSRSTTRTRSSPSQPAARRRAR